MLHASAVRCGPAGILLSPFVTRNGRLPLLSNSMGRRNVDSPSVSAEGIAR